MSKSDCGLKGEAARGERPRGKERAPELRKLEGKGPPLGDLELSGDSEDFGEHAFGDLPRTPPPLCVLTVHALLLHAELPLHARSCSCMGKRGDTPPDGGDHLLSQPAADR